MVKCYKLCSVIDGRYYSYLATAQPNGPREHDLEYIVGETVTPKFGKLFVFDTLFHVEDEFWKVVIRKDKSEEEFAIFEAECDNPVGLYTVPSGFSKKEMKAFWSVYEINGTAPLNIFSYPLLRALQGTLITPSVKLIKKIEV